MLAASLNVPQLRVDAAATAIVTHWGEIDGLVLRTGDRLVLGGGKEGLLLLLPKGFGRPMLGRRSARGLVAEPGGVPASPTRWSVLAGVCGVERALERGAGMPQGRWAVVILVEGGSGLELMLGQLHGSELSADEVDSRVRDALLAARRQGVDVRVGVATTIEQAESLADAAAVNHVRIAVGASQPSEQPAGRVIVGPWRDSAVPSTSVGQRQLSLFDLGRRSG